jgi:hypothetical protein
MGTRMNFYHYLVETLDNFAKSYLRDYQGVERGAADARHRTTSVLW